MMGEQQPLTVEEGSFRRKATHLLRVIRENYHPAYWLPASFRGVPHRLVTDVSGRFPVPPMSGWLNVAWSRWLEKMNKSSVLSGCQ
jgi:hypothetical protein